MSAPGDSIVRVTDGRDGSAFIWLPDVDYLDTQAGPVEVGLDRDIAEQLVHALGTWLAGDQEPESPATPPRRGDAVEAWLKAQRDRWNRHGDSSEFWHEFDSILDDYRLHADTGTPLNQHACEGNNNADDCHGCYQEAQR